MRQPLIPLSPLMHVDYSRVLLDRHGRDPLPAAVRERVTALMRRRNDTPDGDAIDVIDREIVAETSWYAIRPDDIARRCCDLYHFGRALTIPQAALIIAALGEAGYPITGNGAPDYQASGPAPVRGAERDRVIWDAAEYWAEKASRHLTYVSFGDSRGYLPRGVQYDQPGSMHPEQQASLTFGPWSDRGDQTDSHGYMRRHTRRLLLVREEEGPH